MTSALALLTLVPVAYALGPSQKLDYDVKVRFDGFIPIFGGRVAKVDVSMLVGVEGLPADEMQRKAASEIKAVEIRLDGGKLPLTLESVQQYFPRTTVRFTPEGKIVESDAPDTQLPVRLPGLHVKRFPDITYLPIEFPTDGVEVGKEWTYSKPFGDSVVEYRCKPTAIDDASVTLEVGVRQSYTTFENEALEVLPDEKEAAYKVETKLQGQGTAVFDLKKGVLRHLKVEADALGEVVEIATKKASQRKLKTIIETSIAKPIPTKG